MTLLGFRFHPTEVGLVAFYRERKVEKQPLGIGLIKHVDIYKYDPWDLPKEAVNRDIVDMETSHSQSDMSSGDSTVREEAKEVLQASLFLSVCKHTGYCASEGAEPPRSEDIQGSSSGAPLRELRRSDPLVVRRVNELIDSIGRCRGPFEKRLKSSDLKEQQNRLLLWKDHVREFILPLLEEDDDPAQGMEVTAFNTEGKTFPLRFKIWCDKVYVLTGNWKAFVEENQLQDADLLKIWAFRNVRTERLCFVISRILNAPGQNQTEKGARRERRNHVELKPRKVLLSG